MLQKITVPFLFAATTAIAAAGFSSDAHANAAIVSISQRQHWDNAAVEAQRHQDFIKAVIVDPQAAATIQNPVWKEALGACQATINSDKTIQTPEQAVPHLGAFQACVNHRLDIRRASATSEEEYKLAGEKYLRYAFVQECQQELGSTPRAGAVLDEARATSFMACAGDKADKSAIFPVVGLVLGLGGLFAAPFVSAYRPRSCSPR